MTGPKRIMILVSSMHAGGAERVAATLANAWAGRGDDVTVVVSFSGRGSCHYPLSPDIQLTFLADVAGTASRRGKRYLRRFLALRSLIRQERPDVIVGIMWNVNVMAIMATRGLHVPVIASEHTSFAFVPLGKILETVRRLCYPFAGCVTVLTPEERSWVEKRIPRARVCVIPNPMQFPLLSSEPVLTPSKFVPTDRSLLLAVGRLSEEKSFPVLLDAFARIADRCPAWHLVIVGDGPDRVSLETQVTRLGLTDRAVITGRAGNLSDWYRRTALYVMSSRFEGFGLTLAEAMAHGCPAVSFDCESGPRHIIRHGVDGLLVRPVGDAVALAEALLLLMQDEHTREAMAARASESRARFSLEQVLPLWDAVFASLGFPRTAV